MLPGLILIYTVCTRGIHLFQSYLSQTYDAHVQTLFIVHKMKVLMESVYDVLPP